jgi:hypothetical protein
MRMSASDIQLFLNKFGSQPNSVAIFANVVEWAGFIKRLFELLQKMGATTTMKIKRFEEE